MKRPMAKNKYGLDPATYKRAIQLAVLDRFLTRIETNKDLDKEHKQAVCAVIQNQMATVFEDECRAHPEEIVQLEDGRWASRECLAKLEANAPPRKQ
jgi:hypothetical protein